MENASKALIIAGGVLIGIMILSLGVYLFSMAGNLSRSYDEKIAQDAINGFNNQFLVYEKNLTGQDMVSLINLVKENNQKNSGSAEKQITLILDHTELSAQALTENWKVNMMQQMTVTQEPNYRLVSIQYNDSGYVARMEYKTY